MALLSLILRKDNVGKDGTHALRVAIASQGKTAYITTKFKVTESQWKDGRVVRHPNAAIINRKLRAMMAEYEETLDNMNGAEWIPAKELRDILVKGKRDMTMLTEFGDEYVRRLKESNQDSYATNMGYTVKYLRECLGDWLRLEDVCLPVIKKWEDFLFKRGDSPTTVNIRMTHLKALLNAAVSEGIVKYDLFPFRNYRMPEKNVRELWLSVEEFNKLREAKFEGVSERRMSIARDLFLLSFYCAGINLTDLLDAQLDGTTLTFVRKKTADKKRGEKRVSITIQPEASAIISKYLTTEGKLDIGYQFSYGNFRSYITRSLNRIGETLGFERKLMFYSARKTFCQFGFEIGIPLYILEYAIGQTVKESKYRPVFDYIRFMRSHADAAIRAIIDFAHQKNPIRDMSSLQ